MEYKIKLSENDLQILDRVLVEAPYKMVANLIASINEQIKFQQEATTKEKA